MATNEEYLAAAARVSAGTAKPGDVTMVQRMARNPRIGPNGTTVGECKDALTKAGLSQ